MKTSKASFHTGLVLGAALGLVFAGCSKKETPAEPPASAAKPAANDALTQKLRDLDVAAAKKAESLDEMAKAAGAAAQEKTQAAAARVGQAAEAMGQKLAAQEGAAAAAAPTTQPAPADAAGVGAQLVALQQQAASLLTQYSGELESLKTKAVQVKQLVDANAGLLPEGVQAKYQEFNALLPQLTSLVGSLKNYQSADLANLIPKLKDDFSRAQKLYAEIRAMIPQAPATPAAPTAP